MAAPLPPAPPDITKRIQDEYQVFFKRYRDNSTGLRLNSLTSGTPFYISMNPTEANFVCTRESFYLSLLHFSNVDRRSSINRFHKCAQQGIPLAAGAAAVDPVDAAIHAYSILISHLINNQERRPEAKEVIEFLKLHYTDTDRIYYNRIKDQILLLIGEHINALRASPMEIRTNVLDLVHYLFRNEQRYIASSLLAKKVICNFVLKQRQPDMIQVYGTLAPLAKAHFFVYILENNLPISQHTPQIKQDLEVALMTVNSPLNLQLEPNSNAFRVAKQIIKEIGMIQNYGTLTPQDKARLYFYILNNVDFTYSQHIPNIPEEIIVDLEVALMIENIPINQLLQQRPQSIAFQVAQKIKEEIEEELAQQAAERRRKDLTDRFEGSGGSKKGKFNKVKSKSKKTYKNKIKIKNKKSYCRRRRHHRHANVG
jgi:hypothetical protein